MIITSKLRMDLARPGSTQIIHGVQGDTNSRQLEIALFHNGQPCPIPAGSRAMVSYRKTDGRGGEYDTLPDGSCAWSFRENLLFALLAPQVFTTPGTVTLSVTLLTPEGQLSLFPIVLQVSADGGRYVSSENYDRFTGLLPAPDRAAVGQYLRISGLGEDGRVTAIEGVALEDLEAGGTATPLRVTFTGEPGYVTADKTYAEVEAAALAGQSVVGLWDLRELEENMLFHLTMTWQEPGIAVFEGYLVGNPAVFLTLLLCNDGEADYVDLGGAGELVSLESIPEALPNPHVLTLNDISYDGSEAVTVDTRECMLQVLLTQDGTCTVVNGLTYNDLVEALEGGRPVSCLLLAEELGENPLRLTLSMLTAEMDLVFLCRLQPSLGYLCYVRQDGTVYALRTSASLQIGSRIWSMDTDADFTEPVNSLIAEKLAKLTAADVGALSADTTALPNPGKLIFAGAASGEYDGSSEVTITIPVSGAETETVLSDNLLDLSLLTGGGVFYHGGSGFQLVSGEADNYYGYIPLRGAGTYRTKWDNSQHSSTGARLSLVDESNGWVCSVTGTLTPTDSNYVYDMEFVVTQEMIDSGAAKIAFDCHKSIYSTAMLVRNRDYPAEYIPFGYIEVATDSGKKQDNVLSGKTALFLGDSICAATTIDASTGFYNYGWAGLIGEANRMNWTNYGKNGATITNRGTASTWIGTYADRAIAEHPGADYVILEGGCNDADQLKDAGLGEIASGYATFDESTFSGAFEALLLKLVTAFPHAKIGYLIPQKMYAQNDHSAAGHVHRRFFDRATEICKKWGIPVLDLWNGSPLNPSLSTAGLFYTDGQHLTLAGYQALVPGIESWMRTL